MEENNKELRKKICVHLAVCFLALLAVVFVVPPLFRMFLPLIVAWLIAMLANPLVRFLENRIKIMSNSDEIPSVCVNPEVFQMPVMFKKMLMWRERCLLLVEDGYYIGNLKNDAFCDSDDKKFYELKNAKIIIEKGEFSITIVHNDDSLVQLKCKSDSDKMALINKMNEVIYKISEKNAFTILTKISFFK